MAARPASTPEARTRHEHRAEPRPCAQPDARRSPRTRQAVACRAEQAAAGARRWRGIGLDEREAKMRASQLWNWLYVNGVTDFERDDQYRQGRCAQKLADTFMLDRPEIVTEQVSIDGTRKWLFRFRDPQNPTAAAGRGRDRLHPRGRSRHALRLLAGRLHAHLLVLPHRHAEAGAQPHRRRNPRPDPDGARAARRFPRRRAPRRWRPRAGAARSGGSEGDSRAITNVVMMGMGEPLYNYDNVKQALLIASAERRHVAVASAASRSRPRASCRYIEPTGREIGVMLAISLHAVRDDLRDMLVPINKKWPLEGAARGLPQLSGPLQCPPHHLRICDARRTSTTAMPMRANWCGCWPAFRPRST